MAKKDTKDMSGKEMADEINYWREKAKLQTGLNNLQYEYLQNTRESMEIQKSILGDAKQYVTYAKKTKELEKDILFLQKQKALAVGKNAAETKQLQKALDEEIKKLQAQKELYEANLKAVSKTKMLVNETSKALGKLPGTIKDVYSKIKGYGLFDMDKSIRSSALGMGLLKSRSDTFRKSITAASGQITQMGGTIEETTKMQSAYSEEIGRSVLLGAKNLVNITAIAKGTGMGADEAAKMAAEFEQQGMSVEKVAKFMNQTMMDASKMGLNSSKVIKNITSNMKMLNRYNFKGGVQGFKKMAETVTKLGINMNSVAGMADKLMNIEGAVEMSAKLQVLGGKWSQLADPFKLMYMARNDMEGLTKAVADAASQNAKFDKEGNVQLAAVEMSRLREVAEATGVELETLVTAGKNMAKFKTIRTQMSVTGLSDEEKEFLENTAQFNDKGQAYIEIDGNEKLLSQLGSSAKDVIKKQLAEQKSLKERAKAAMSFDEQINSLIEQFKVILLPIAEKLADAFGKKGGVGEKLSAALTKFANFLEKQKIADKLGAIFEWIGDKIGQFISYVSENPIKSFAIALAGKAAMWIANGVSLATGFKLGMSGFNMLGGLFGRGGAAAAASTAAGGAGSTAAGGGAGAGGAAAGGAGAAAATAAAVVSVIKTAKDQVDFFSSESARGTGAAGWLEALGGTGAGILEIIPKAFGLDTQGFGLGIKGMGTDDVALGRAVYRKLHPNAPTIIPNKDLIADIKANPDKYPDDVVSGAATAQLDDGIVSFNSKDKFMKLNDSTMIAGTNANGNNNLARSIMSMYGGAPGKANSNASASVKVDEIKIGGVIDVKVNGESTQESREVGKNLMSDPLFLRELSLKINEATNKALKGKNS
jgi:uncharacterized phage-associated protein